jgi:predicted membrane protein
MDSNRSFRISGQFFFGLAALFFGVVFLLDNMDLIDGRIYLRYWPLFLVAFGLVKVFNPRHHGTGRFVGIMFIIIGGLLLLRTFGMTDLGFRDIWPLILVLIGGSLIWGSRSRFGMASSDMTPADPSSEVNGVAILGGFQRSANTQDFRGGDLTAVMGGCDIDLRQAAIKGESAIITVFALWGGIKIKLPHTWSVSLEGTPFLGGFDDRTVQPSDSTAKRLIVRGTAIMGGVELIN